MSKQKQSNTQSTSTQARRFSGPELSELLDQVAREHGADAAISAVNKIRSGGVAGFFCREEFEVVVQATEESAPQATTPGSDPHTTPEPTRSSETTTGMPKSDIAPSSANGRTTDSATDPTDPTESTPMDGLDRLAAEAPIAPPTLPTAPDRTAAPAVPTAPDTTAPAMPGRAIFAGPTPISAHSAAGEHRAPTPSAAEDRFRSLLEQRIDDASAADRVVSDRIAAPVKPRTPTSRIPLPGVTEQKPVWPSADPDSRPIRRSVPVAAPKPEPQLQPIVPAPGLPMSQSTVTGGVGVLTPAALTATTTQGSDFWLRLQRTQHELASFMPLASHAVATIGPLSLTTPIVKRLRATPGLESADVIVLTDRAEIVSEPSWQLVRSGHQLVDAVLERGSWPMLLLIDVPVELPNWLPPLENRLRIAGIGLFRYAVPGNPTVDELDRYRLGSDVPYVIDLISRVRPDDLVDFVARRHPIASVAGADLNAELLVAMREQVDLGP